MLDAEFNSASNDASFKRTASGKYGVWVKILCFWPYSTSMSRKNLLLDLGSPSNLGFLDAEFNSASNGTSFKWLTYRKYRGLGQNTRFLEGFSSFACRHSLLKMCWLSNHLGWMQN